MARVILVCALSIVLAACTSNPSQLPESTTFKATPLARIVIQHGQSPQTLLLSELARDVLTGFPVSYSGALRPPSSADGTPTINCLLVQRIGIALAVERIKPLKDGRSSSLSKPLHFRWHHEAYKTSHRVYSQFTRVGNRLSNFQRPSVRLGNGVEVFADVFPLQKVDLKDGAWKVTVTYMGERLLEETFNLEGCR